MQLGEIGLNRYLVKDGASLSPSSIPSDNSNIPYNFDNSQGMFSQNVDNSGFADISNTTNYGTGGTDAGASPASELPSGIIDAHNIQPGTVVTNCVLQTSGRGDRVEMSAFVTSELAGIPSNWKNLDSLIAYANNVAMVVINKLGIYAQYIEVALIDAIDASVTNINVLTSFIYHGYKQPQVFGGQVSSSGTSVFLPTSWVSQYLGTGDYKINMFPLATTNYSVTITPINAANIPSIYNKTTTDFEVVFYDTLGNPVDTDFNFVLTNNLP